MNAMHHGRGGMRCSNCGKPHGRPTGEINRAAKIGARLFCDRRCAGLARRAGKTKEQKVAEKRIYDAAYRAKNLAMLKAKKRAYFERTYDPKKAAVERKKRMHLHVAYCRQPRYKAWKQRYDQQYRAREYGPFADAYLLAVNLNREIKTRSSNYEIRLENQTLNKKQGRTRQGSEAYSRDRNSRAQGKRA
jgi:hypothetical protein